MYKSITKKQSIIILSLLLASVIIALLLIFFISDKDSGYQDDLSYTGYTPEMMSSQEKARFNLPEDSNIQVLKRNDDGEVDVYKIIREERDLEYDLDALHRPVR